MDSKKRYRGKFALYDLELNDIGFLYQLFNCRREGHEQRYTYPFGAYLPEADEPFLKLPRIGTSLLEKFLMW
jgi:hypothetical protein